MREINIDQFVTLTNTIPVDVRSPGEFNEFHIPGAVNIPIFTDDERAIIGTIYKKEGTDAAKWRAMEVVSPKLPSILGQIRSLQEDGNSPVIYCWRGGMRSRSVATFLSFAGISIPRLIGGYRAYRQYILEKIPTLIPEKAITIHGMTGVGKTEVLEKLQDRGMPVIDLEKMAGHRGSIFGTFGLFEGHNQKTFDALLYQTLSKLSGSSFFLVEAESKRIGKVIQPDQMIEKKQHGFNIKLHASLHSRTERIYREYVQPYLNEDWFQGKVIERLSYLSKRIKDLEIITNLEEATQSKNYKMIIQILLKDYYDPRYSYKQLEYEGPFHHIDAENTELAVKEIINVLQSKNCEHIHLKNFESL